MAIGRQRWCTLACSVGAPGQTRQSQWHYHCHPLLRHPPPVWLCRAGGRQSVTPACGTHEQQYAEGQRAQATLTCSGMRHCLARKEIPSGKKAVSSEPSIVNCSSPVLLAKAHQCVSSRQRAASSVTRCGVRGLGVRRTGCWHQS